MNEVIDYLIWVGIAILLVLGIYVCLWLALVVLSKAGVIV